MKRRIVRGFFILALLALCAPLPAQEIILSVSDFSVESDNTSYKFLGKGLSTLVAGELRRTKTVKILEREQLNRIIEEQKLTLSGLLDESKQVEIGQLLSADYIVFGQIIDMAAAVLISVRMADIETGEVVWEDSMTEKLESYDYIGAYFAQSILAELNLEAEEATVAKVETKEVKQETAIIALSSGIDAYDRGDEAKAREELKTVQQIDPENEAARFYLSKLQALSPKFRVEIVEYTSPYSAAALGFIENGKIYSWFLRSFDPPGLEYTGGGSQVIDDSYAARDVQNGVFLGFSMPLGESMGLGAGLTTNSLDLKASYNEYEDHTLNSIFQFEGETVDSIVAFYQNYGGYVSFGMKLGDSVGLGLSAMGCYLVNGNDPGVSDEFADENNTIVHEGFFFSLYPGIMVQGDQGRLIWDLNAAYSNYKIYYIDYDDLEIKLGNMPLVIDTSLTYGLLVQRLFLGLKGISDIYIDDRGGYSIRLIPMAEYWILDSLSVRGGYEYSHLDQAGTFVIGHGAVAGLTVKLGKFDINANFTYRQKPARMLPGYTVANMKLLVGLEYSPEFLARK